MITVSLFACFIISIIVGQKANTCENIELKAINGNPTQSENANTIESEIKVLVDSDFSVYKSSIFSTWRWPYLSPVGPSGRFICLCPPQSAQQAAARPIASISLSHHFLNLYSTDI